MDWLEFMMVSLKYLVLLGGEKYDFICIRIRYIIGVCSCMYSEKCSYQLPEK